MRKSLVFALLAFAACSEQTPRPGTLAAAGLGHADAVIAAERAFAADGSATGWVEAFEKWSEPEGIVLGAGPTSARAFLTNIDPANRGDTTLKWAPEFAGASAGGDFGFTTGPFAGDGSAFGYYFTVWRKQNDGGWRWVYDGGVDTRTPTTVDPAFKVTVIDPPSRGEAAPDMAKAAVQVLEAGLAQSAAEDAPLALGGQFASVSRMHRNDIAPVIGAEAISAALEAGPRRIAFRQVRSDASANGDMVFTLGEACWDGGAGYYGRIWAHQAEGWRIVFDQIVLRDLPAEAQQ